MAKAVSGMRQPNEGVYGLGQSEGKKGGLPVPVLMPRGEGRSGWEKVK